MTINYTGPDLESNTTLAELVGDALHRLYLICDWQRATIRFEACHESENGMPMRRWHGHEASWHVPIMGEAMATELVAELTPLVGRIAAGYASEWDGSNHVATFDDDAQDARSALDGLIENLNWQDTGCGGLWAAADWLEGDPPDVSADATDAELVEQAAHLQAAAHYEAIHLWGLDTYLEERRDAAREQVRDCAHVWAPADGEPATAGSSGYAVTCHSCNATGWQPASWRTGPVAHRPRWGSRILPRGRRSDRG